MVWLKLKRKRTKINFDTYMGVLDRCNRKYSEALKEYGKAKTHQEAVVACNKMVRWSSMNNKISKRLYSDHLGY